MEFHIEEIEVEVPGSHPCLNITQRVNEIIGKSGLREGHVVVQTRHTTTGLVVQEDERGFKKDFLKVLERIVPEGEYYEHDDFTRRTENIGPDERKNGAAHIRASFLQTSLSPLIFQERQLKLGKWQDILLIDFDPEGRPFRNVIVQVYGEK